ncbi:DUF2948 family protein [Pseudoroseicyclus tamaricis]|uniref:DUF2948 family protein n=1 Tax=Pseudoroseicyclus tamaricis TaxID=2705421 RepID=A0A6B2JPF6_9RHOB|nr:DUF2948 family protein [Pseudoroseicyclus tamaricis]NDU99977.1 DUF2948 family protein [Pseudoroseicyclus tamaricis]
MSGPDSDRPLEDARFEEGAETPLRLIARDAEDLAVISSLCQDAVLPASEMRWDRSSRRFALLLNRFRWEDATKAEARRRPFERVRSLLVIADVLRVQSQGLPPRAEGTVLSLLSLAWEPGEDGAGRLILTLAGDAAIAIEAEDLEVNLRDVTRPYLAPSRKAPEHDADDDPRS